MVAAYEKVGGNIVCVAGSAAASRPPATASSRPGARDGRLTEVKGLVEKPQPEDGAVQPRRRRPLHPPARGHARSSAASARAPAARSSSPTRMARADRQPALPRPHLRRRAPRLRRQDRLRHRQSRAGARRRRRRAGDPRLARRAGMICTAILVGDGAGPPAHAPRRRAAYRGPGFVWTHVESDDERSCRSIARRRHSRRRRQRPGRDRDAAALRPDRAGRDRQPARPRGGRDRRFATGWSRSGCGCGAGKVNSVTRRPLAATAAVMAQMEAGRILDPGDLVAAYRPRDQRRARPAGRRARRPARRLRKRAREPQQVPAAHARSPASAPRRSPSAASSRPTATR